jgi:hypothetical protein
VLPSSFVLRVSLERVSKLNGYGIFDWQASCI